MYREYKADWYRDISQRLPPLSADCALAVVYLWPGYYRRPATQDLEVGVPRAYSASRRRSVMLSRRERILVPRLSVIPQRRIPAREENERNVRTALSSVCLANSFPRFPRYSETTRTRRFIAPRHHRATQDDASTPDISPHARRFRKK